MHASIAHKHRFSGAADRRRIACLRRAGASARWWSSWPGPGARPRRRRRSRRCGPVRLEARLDGAAVGFLQPGGPTLAQVAGLAALPRRRTLAARRAGRVGAPAPGAALALVLATTAGRRARLRLSPRARRRDRARRRARGGRRSRRLDRLPRAAAGALLRLRRALERRRAAGHDGRELRLGRALQRGEQGGRQGHDPAGRVPAARRRDLLPDPLAAVEPRLRRAGRQRRDEHVRPCRARAAAAGASRSRRRGWRCGSSPGPRPARALRALQRGHGPPAGAAGALGLRAVAADGPAQRAAAGRPGRRPRQAARRRRAGVGGRDPAALPPVRPRPRPRGLRGAARRLLPRQRPGGADLRQPDALRLVRAALLRCPRGGRAARRPRRSAGAVRLVRRRHRPGRLHDPEGGRVRLLRSGGRRRLPRRRRAHARAPPTTAGWRTSASTRRSTRATRPVAAAARCTTATRRSTTARCTG